MGSPGSSAVIDDSPSCLWTSTPVKSNISGNKTSKSGPKIIHPIFDQCSKLTKDEYWISIYKSAAVGKMPRGFSYRNGYLSHRHGNSKSDRITIPPTADKAYEETINFFRKYGLKSDIDIEEASENHGDNCSSSYGSNVPLSKMSWKSVSKNRRLVSLLIGEYISNCFKTNPLFSGKNGDNLKKDFETMVERGYTIGVLKDKIKFERGKIIDIGGINFDKEKEIFWIDIDSNIHNIINEKKRVQTKTREVIKDTDLYSQWIHFIRSFVGINYNDTVSNINSKGVDAESATIDETETVSVEIH